MRGGVDMKELLFPEARIKLIEALVARRRPDLWEKFKQDGVDFFSNSFLAGVKFGRSLKNKAI